jgi:TonB family protein
MMRFLTFLTVIFIGVSATFAQQHRVDKESWDSSIEELKKISTVPLRIPNYFPYKSGLSAKERKMRIYTEMIISENTFGLSLCLSKDACHSLYYYAEIYGEKITPQTEKFEFGKKVQLAKGITGYFTDISCGSSCGPPYIEWEEKGYRYIAMLDFAEVDTLVKFVNSAINNDLSKTQKPDDETTIQGGVLNGKAIYLPKPNYPAKAKAANARGAVNVEVLVNKAGNVVSAKAVSGHDLLREWAESAARLAKFKQTRVKGKLVQVKGIVIYNFAP